MTALRFRHKPVWLRLSTSNRQVTLIRPCVSKAAQQRRTPQHGRNFHAQSTLAFWSARCSGALVAQNRPKTRHTCQTFYPYKTVSVAQASQSAASPIYKSASRDAAADLEVGDTVGLETCATPDVGEHAKHRSTAVSVGVKIQTRHAMPQRGLPPQQNFLPFDSRTKNPFFGP
jgi:hypothetical protein